MKDIKVSAATTGRCAEIKDRLSAYLRMPRLVNLRISLGDFALPGDLAIEKSAVVLARTVRDDANLNDDLAVEFSPSAAPGWFPTFRGVLDVFPGEKDGESIVELTGSYDPPFGAAGEAFDAALGHLIAQRSIASLLQQIISGSGNQPAEFQHAND